MSARKLVRAAGETYGPMFLRFTRDAVPVVYDEDAQFVIGKANKLREGRDVALIAVGDTLRLAIEAAQVLHEPQGIEARVLDMHTIKPLDEEAVQGCIADIGKIVTVEDHNKINGLGSAVCECVAEAGRGIVRRVAIQDKFGESAPYERLLAKNGITVENIVAQAKAIPVTVQKIRREETRRKGDTKMKKLLALILALTMVFALAACGSEPLRTATPPPATTSPPAKPSS